MNVQSSVARVLRGSTRNLQLIRRFSVHLQRYYTSTPPNDDEVDRHSPQQIPYKVVNTIVSSLRVDAIAAAGFGVSRRVIQQFLLKHFISSVTLGVCLLIFSKSLSYAHVQYFNVYSLMYASRFKYIFLSKEIWEACLDGRVMINQQTVKKKSKLVKVGDEVYLDKEFQISSYNPLDVSSKKSRMRRSRLEVLEIGPETKKGGYQIKLQRLMEFCTVLT